MRQLDDAVHDARRTQREPGPTLRVPPEVLALQNAARTQMHASLSLAVYPPEGGPRTLTTRGGWEGTDPRRDGHNGRKGSGPSRLVVLDSVGVCSWGYQPRSEQARSISRLRSYLCFSFSFTPGICKRNCFHLTVVSHFPFGFFCRKFFPQFSFSLHQKKISSSPVLILFSVSVSLPLAMIFVFVRRLFVEAF